MPMISVIVPVYKVEPYLQRCVDSILAQSYTDFEIILVDDGSPDNCGAICDEYSKKDNRVKVLHQQNQGVASARNNGVKISCGEWICFVDSDDLIHQDMLKILLDVAEKTGALLSACNKSGGEHVENCFFETVSPLFNTIEINEETIRVLYNTEWSTVYWSAWAKIIHREIIERFQFTPGRFYEDNAVAFRWLIEAGKICHTEAQLYFYFSNPSSIVRSGFDSRRLDYLWALQEQIRIYRYYHYSIMEEELAGRYLVASEWMYGLLKSENRNIEKEKEILKEMQAVYEDYKERLHWDSKQRRNLEQFLFFEKNHLHGARLFISKLESYLSRHCFHS